MDATTAHRRIRKVPASPGVYFWRDAKGTPLYIGKANNLRSRLSSYPRAEHSRLVAMVRAASRITWQTTPTDIEALILESQLIKRYRPRYNVEWRDDKNYFYVRFSDDEFPKVVISHRPGDIGPFTEGIPLKTTLRALRRLFPYCSCKKKHHVRCLNAHMGLCPGYCCLKTPATRAQKTAYARDIRAIRDLLTGKRDTVIRRLAKTDVDTAMKLFRVFQNAQINVRNERLAARHLGAVDELRDELRLPDTPHRIEGYDIANIQGAHAAGAMVVFDDGRATNHEYRLFNIRGDVTGDVPMLRQVLERRLAHTEWPSPDLIVVDGGKGQLNAAVRAIAAVGRSVPVIAIKKNERHQPEYALTSLQSVPRALAALPHAARDLLVHVDSEAHRFAISHYRHRHRKVLV